MHAYYTWRMDTAKRVGDRVFAQFMNNHSPVFVLTRDHLQLAIDSGSFLRWPEPSRCYDEIEAVTTDLQHLDRYVGVRPTVAERTILVHPLGSGTVNDGVREGIRPPRKSVGSRRRRTLYLSVTSGLLDARERPESRWTSTPGRWRERPECVRLVSSRAFLES